LVSCPVSGKSMIDEAAKLIPGLPTPAAGVHSQSRQPNFSHTGLKSFREQAASPSPSRRSCC
jgi:hypothetical protein